MTRRWTGSEQLGGSFDSPSQIDYQSLGKCFGKYKQHPATKPTRDTLEWTRFLGMRGGVGPEWRLP